MNCVPNAILQRSHRASSASYRARRFADPTYDPSEPVLELSRSVCDPTSKIDAVKKEKVKHEVQGNKNKEMKQAGAECTSNSSLSPPPLAFKKPTKQEVEGYTPFPDFSRPVPAEAHLVVSLLSSLHGLPTKGENTMPVLDSLVRTILSQNTTDKTSRLAFLSLKKTFPSWREVYDAYGSGRVEAAIKQGGLAEMKARNIHNILAYLLYTHNEKCPHGEPSYEWLRTESTAFIKNELCKHQGVGPKTISCVLMFNLHREEFPVDTHVWHIAKQLKWVPSTASAEQSYTHLNARLPGATKYPLHVLLVEHGKRCPRCSKNGRLQLPQEGECPLINLGDKLLLASSGASAAATSSIPSESRTLVKIDPGSSGTKRRADLNKAEEQGCGEHVWVAVKTEPESPSPLAKRQRGQKVLQHLDMQG